MRADIASTESFTTSWCPAEFVVSPEFAIGVVEPPLKHSGAVQTFASRSGSFCDYHVMTGLPRFVMPLLAGFAVTFLQLVLAVGLLAPEEPLADRYFALVQHDSYWFKNIVDRGYQTIIPPIDHKVMEISNVAFFPAYPAIAALLRYAFNINSSTALLITAQLAAWGFWVYFFLFCKRWNVPPLLQTGGALLILAHPASFFLVAAYSESVFLMALLGFIYWIPRQVAQRKFWLEYTESSCPQRASSELCAPLFL